MWHSEKDIINDLAILNDFGEPGDTEPYKVLCSVGRGSKAKKKPQHKTTLDPRTGEEIEIGKQCLSLEDMFYKGKGRGALLGSKSYTLLHKQLRLARPLGSSDEIIESYCRRNERLSQSECSVKSHNLKSNNSLGKNSPDTLCSTKVVKSNETKSRIKAVRNSNTFNNALISGLLKNRDISSLSFETIHDLQKFDVGQKNFECIYKNGDAMKSSSFHTDSLSDDSNSLNTSEDTLESLCDSSKYSTKEQRRNKMKELKNESCNTCTHGSDEDCNDEVKVTRTAKEVNGLKIGNDSRSSAYTANIEEAIGRNEVYRKLGEKLNKTSLSSGKNQNTEFFPSRRHGSGNRSLHFQEFSDSDSTTNKFVYDELSFPPLVKNS